MENLNESNVQPKRHGCVTAWLIIMIVLNSLVAFEYLFFTDFVVNNMPSGFEVSESQMLILGFLCIANVLFAVLLFRWKKIGFWGFLLVTIGASIINYSIGIPRMSTYSSIVSVAVLFAIFQIKRDGVAAWKHLN